jgi:hypothetical protein
MRYVCEYNSQITDSLNNIPNIQAVLLSSLLTVSEITVMFIGDKQ